MLPVFALAVSLHHDMSRSWEPVIETLGERQSLSKGK